MRRFHDGPPLTFPIMLVVLGAALAHASWNSLVKSAGDPFMTAIRVALWCGAIGAVVALVTPWPTPAAIPFIAASAALHVVYFGLVGRLYRTADLSVAYPLMRGFAPLIATAIAAATLGERLSGVALTGVLGLVAGVVGMGASGLANGRIDAATVGVALVNSVVIASYSVIDGEGARLNGATVANAFAFNGWADASAAALMAPLVAAWRGRAAFAAFAHDPARAAAAGVAAFTGYALVVTAMTRADIGAVAALRESSVLFAALIGVFALGEPMRRDRAAATVLIVAGLAALKFG